MDGWVDGWMGVKAGLRIAYSNQKSAKSKQKPLKLQINDVLPHPSIKLKYLGDHFKIETN